MSQEMSLLQKRHCECHCDCVSRILAVGEAGWPVSDPVSSGYASCRLATWLVAISDELVFVLICGGAASFAVFFLSPLLLWS
jgi:glycerate-2-kinase